MCSNFHTLVHKGQVSSSVLSAITEQILISLQSNDRKNGLLISPSARILPKLINTKPQNAKRQLMFPHRFSVFIVKVRFCRSPPPV